MEQKCWGKSLCRRVALATRNARSWLLVERLVQVNDDDIGMPRNVKEIRALIREIHFARYGPDSETKVGTLFNRLADVKNLMNAALAPANHAAWGGICGGT